jgi:hypothetical protein
VQAQHDASMVASLALLHGHAALQNTLGPHGTSQKLL